MIISVIVKKLKTRSKTNNNNDYGDMAPSRLQAGLQDIVPTCRQAAMGQEGAHLNFVTLRDASCSTVPFSFLYITAINFFFLHSFLFFERR